MVIRVKETIKAKNIEVTLLGSVGDHGLQRHRRAGKDGRWESAGGRADLLPPVGECDVGHGRSRRLTTG